MRGMRRPDSGSPVAAAWRRLVVLWAAHACLYAKTFYFPHYADGDGLRMTFVVSNHSDATATLSVYDPAGEPEPA